MNTYPFHHIKTAPKNKQILLAYPSFIEDSEEIIVNQGIYDSKLNEWVACYYAEYQSLGNKSNFAYREKAFIVDPIGWADIPSFVKNNQD